MLTELAPEAIRQKMECDGAGPAGNFPQMETREHGEQFHPA